MRPGIARLACLCIAALLSVFATAAADEPLPPGATLRLGSPRFRHPQASIALSADGKQLITCSRMTKSVRVWDAVTGNLLREIAIDATGFFTAIAWALDDKTFVTAETVRGNKEKAIEHFLRIHDAQTGKLIRSITYSQGNYQGTPIRYLGGGKEIAVQTQTGIGIWEVETGAELIHNAFRAAGYSEFGASPDGKRIAVVGPVYSGEVYVWDWEGEKGPKTLSMAWKGRPRSVVISPDKKQLALLDDMGGPIRLIDAESGVLLREFHSPNGKRMLRNAVFTPDGRKLLANDDGGRNFSHNEQSPGGLFVWDVATGKLERRLGVADAASDLTISADGKFVAAVANGFPIWELSSGRQINPLAEADAAWCGWAIARSGFILTLSDAQPARLWNEKSGRLLHTFPHQGWTRAGDISPDGTRAATSANDDSIKVWDTATGKLIMKLPGHDDMNGTTALRFSADSRRLVSFGTDFNLRTTDLSNGKAIREFPIRGEGLGFPGDSRSRGIDGIDIEYAAIYAALSPDGAQLCIQGRGKRFLFDTNTGKEMASFDLGPGFVHSKPVFSPDGAQVLVIGRGKMIETPIKGGGTRYEEAKEKPLVCWDTKTGKKRWETTLLMGFNHGLAYAPDGRSFAIRSQDGETSKSIEFREAATGNLLGRLDHLPMPARDLDFTSDGKRVVLVMVDGTVLLYNVPEFKK